MAVKKFILSFGQSNGGPSPDLFNWLLKHPELNLRLIDPNASGVGSYSDAFTMPGSFTGFTTLDLYSRAIRSIRYLTFYHPWATGYDTYPGVGRILAGSSGTTLNVVQIFKTGGYTSSQQFTITRQKTGETRTVTAGSALAGGAGTALTISSAFATTPVVGEQYTYEVKCWANGTNSTYELNIKFGQKWIGTLNGLQLNCLSGTPQNQGHGRIITGVDTGNPFIVTTNAFSANASLGDVLTITQPSTITSWTIGNAPVANFKQYAYFLPWTMYEGYTTSNADSLVTRPNPYPKGFDYPNHWHLLPAYSPMETGKGSVSPGVSYHVGLASSIQDALGEDIYVVASDFGGSTLAHTELGTTTALVTEGYGTIGWSDYKQQGSWSPGEPNGCFARLMDELDAAIAAAAIEGNTLQCVGVFFTQGEGDGSFENMANRYLYNLKTFKTRIRQELKTRGLWTASAETLPWVHPKINPDYWSYASTINTAIERAAQDDRYMRTFDVSDIPRKPDDLAHYSGIGAVMLEERAYAAWQNIRASESASTQGVLDICNLALSHIGDTAKVTSIDPVDGSTQAALCARFYPIARNSLLEMRYWSFATRRVALTAVENSWPEWDYCYMVPPGVASIFAVLPPEATDDYSTRFSPTDSPGYFANNIPIIAAGRYAPQPFQVEVNADGDQIILTDQADAVLRYCSLVTEPNHFTPLFSMALSWHLASMLAGPILKGDIGSAEAKRCQQMMAAYLSKAEASDGSQRNIKPEHIVSWMSGR
jgi:hypothetical protein